MRNPIELSNTLLDTIGEIKDFGDYDDVKTALQIVKDELWKRDCAKAYAAKLEFAKLELEVPYGNRLNVGRMRISDLAPAGESSGSTSLTVQGCPVEA